MLVELLSFFVNLLFFIDIHEISGQQVWFVILHFGHPFKAVIAFLLCRLFPSTHEVIDQLEVEGKSQLKFADVQPTIIAQMKTIFSDSLALCEKELKIFSLVSLVNLVIDLISFLVVYIQLAKNDKITLLAQLWLVVLNLMADFYFLTWVVHFVVRLPVDLRKPIASALVGLGDKMRIAFGIPVATSPNQEAKRSNSKPKSRGRANSRNRE